MARKGRYTRLLVNEFDFSGVSNSLEVAFDVERIDTTPFQATGSESIAGDTTGTITSSGYFTDVTAGNFEKEMYDALAGSESVYVGALFGTDTAACPAYVARAANVAGLTIASPVDGVITVNGEWTQGTGVLRGLRVWSGTFSATGAQTSPGYIDLGAAGAAGGMAWLFVQSITGSATNATVTLESDDNTSFTSAATEGTFTFSAVGGYEIALSGTVDRYVRLNCTSKGGATSFVVVGIAAVSGVTY